MNKIRVMLVDDHSVVRAGLRLLLESEGDIAVVGEATDGMEAVSKAKEIVPDVIVMDITMPKLNGLEAARQIRRDNEKVAILFLTMHQNEEYFFQALKVGGSGYIPKSAEDVDVLNAVRAVAEGQTYIHPSVAQILVTDYLGRTKDGAVQDPYESLTDREKEVFHYIASGQTNRQIAEALHLSVNTVHNHRTSIMDKLGLRNRMELLKYAIRKGIVTEDS